jgi:type II secretory pathway component PulC
VDKKKIQIYAAVSLVVVFVAILLIPKDKKAASVELETPEVKGVQTVLDSIRLIKSNKIDPAALKNLEELKGAQVGGRNPFDILVQTNVIATPPPEAVAETVIENAEPFPEINVQGVVYAQDNAADSVVIINGEELKIGDAVEGWEIVLVNDDLVMFKKGTSVHKLSLYEKPPEG